MSGDSDNQAELPDGGVLSSLPRTRPQRVSARRAAARARSQSETATPPASRAPKRKTPATAKAATAKAAPKAPSSRRAATATGTSGKPSAKRRAPAKPNPAPRAPKQGYEPEEEVELGKTVHPPSGGELIESLADIFGELASAGASAGGRLLKDALSVFRRP